MTGDTGAGGRGRGNRRHGDVVEVPLGGDLLSIEFQIRSASGADDIEGVFRVALRRRVDQRH